MATDTAKKDPDTTTPEQNVTPENPNAYLEEPVTVTLHKDNGDYKDDLFVCVNGRSFQIQRGKPVQVPRYVAQVIEDGRAQDARASTLAEQTANDAKRAEKENS